MNETSCRKWGSKMDYLQGKHFSITDPKNVNTVIYQVNRTEKEFEQKSPKFTIERLKSRAELVGENKEDLLRR